MQPITDSVAHRATPPDAAATGGPQGIDHAGSLAELAAENLVLRQEAADAHRELLESRARLLSVAAQERRQIQRDLHDGAQQRLVALRIELGLAAELVRDRPAECEVRLHDLLGAVDDALTELRAFVNGSTPPLLSDHGLDAALREAAARCAIPARLRSSGVGRLPVDLEVAVYFCVLEALQNVAKHAVGAGQVWIDLQLVDDELRFDVQDDGTGVRREAVTPGTGMVNMFDRMAALDGELKVTFEDGTGTKVSGRVPTRSHALQPSLRPHD
ncbi:MAG: hypothetical protein JHD16_13760 [Solirubrobacteraceae bacterium]|nr:hypothetical protein [Solirubrobacteraceae bacterium]